MSGPTILSAGCCESSLGYRSGSRARPTGCVVSFHRSRTTRRNQRVPSRMNASPGKDDRHSEVQAWVRFLVALFGLAIAFAAALFSTVASRQGNVLATAILASGALLAAGLVGLFTVPYLARRVDAGRWIEAFDYDVTKEGVAYLALALIIAVAALNTGNNLLFVIVSAMLAAIVMSGIVSNAMLRGLELEVTLPEHVFAGESVASHVVLRNTRRLLPAFSVTVVTPDPKKRK